MAYKVKCVIEDPAYQSDAVIIKPYSCGGTEYCVPPLWSLNGTPFTVTAALTFQSNAFEAKGVGNDGLQPPLNSVFTISNLDQNATIKVSSCVAYPATQSVKVK